MEGREGAELGERVGRRRVEEPADDEVLDAGGPRRLGLDDVDLVEEDLELGGEEGGVVALEDFGDEGAAGQDRLEADLERRDEQLGLDVLVDVVEAGHW